VNGIVVTHPLGDRGIVRLSKNLDQQVYQSNQPSDAVLYGNDPRGVVIPEKQPQQTLWTKVAVPPEFPDPDQVGPPERGRFTPLPTPFKEPIRTEGLRVGDALRQQHLDQGSFLLGHTSSLGSQQVAAYLKYLGVDAAGTGQFRSVPCDEKALKSEWFAVLTASRCKLPVLVMNGQVLNETVPILRFLYEQFEACKHTKEQTKLHNTWLDEMSVASEYFNFLLMYFATGGTYPDGSVTVLKASDDEVKDVVKYVMEYLWKLDTMILAKASHPFLCGVSFTVVDAAFAMWPQTLMLLAKFPLKEFFPNILNYQNRCHGLPWFHATYGCADAGLGAWDALPGAAQNAGFNWLWDRLFNQRDLSYPYWYSKLPNAHEWQGRLKPGRITQRQCGLNM